MSDFSDHRRDSAMSSSSDFALETSNPDPRRSSFNHPHHVMTHPHPMQMTPSSGSTLAPPVTLIPGSGSVSSGCASDDGSTDSLLEHDLHKLSLAVTEQALLE